MYTHYNLASDIVRKYLILLFPFITKVVRTESPERAQNVLILILILILNYMSNL